MGGKMKKKAKQHAAPEPAEPEIDWEEGAKKPSKKQLEKQEKQREAAEKKKEREAQMAAEEESNAHSKKKGKGKKQNRDATRSGGGRSSGLDDALNQTSTISAEGLDDSLAALSLLKKDAVGNNEIDRHPERRFKHALNEYTERRLPELRKENPGMRKQQLQEMAYKEFQKSDENPFNKEVNVSYNASQQDVEDKKSSIKQKRSKKYER